MLGYAGAHQADHEGAKGKGSQRHSNPSHKYRELLHMGSCSAPPVLLYFPRALRAFVMCGGLASSSRKRAKKRNIQEEDADQMKNSHGLPAAPVICRQPFRPSKGILQVMHAARMALRLSVI